MPIGAVRATAMHELKRAHLLGGVLLSKGWVWPNAGAFCKPTCQIFSLSADRDWTANRRIFH